MDVKHYETCSKKLKAWRRRLCIKCCIGRRFYLLIFDRDDGRNFHKILLNGFQHLTLHVDDESTIYLSEKCEDVRCRDVYSYKLSDHDSEIPKVLDKTNVTSAPPLSSSKLLPATIGYGRHLVIFSTLITYWDIADTKNPDIDFEIYDPKGKNHVRLPQLCIRRCGTHYELVDPIHSCATTFIGNGYSSLYPDTSFVQFKIVGYCLSEYHILIVQTDFDESFSLHLSSKNARWELFRGILHHESQFYMKKGFCVDTFGAYPMELNAIHKQMCLSDNQSERLHLVRMIYERVRCGYGVTRRVPFGVTVPFPKSDVMTFCDDGVACIVQVGTDVEEDNAYLSVHLLELDFSKFPWKAVHPLELDLSKFPWEEQEQDPLEGKEDELQKWVKPIKSFNIPMDIPPIRWEIFPFDVFGMFSF